MPTTFNTKRFKKPSDYKSPTEKKKEEDAAKKAVSPAASAKGSDAQKDVRGLGTNTYYEKGFSTKPNYTLGDRLFYGARNIFRKGQKDMAGWSEKYDEFADSVGDKIRGIGKNIGKPDERGTILKGGMPSIEALEQYGEDHPELTSNKEENDAKVNRAIEWGKQQAAQKAAKEAAAGYQERGRKRTATEKGVSTRKLDIAKALAPSAEEQKAEQKKIREALVPATPFKSSKPSPAVHSEPEDEGPSYLPNDDDEGETLSDAEAELSPREKRQAEKKIAEETLAAKQKEYADLAALVYGAGKKIGRDYTAEDNDKLIALEKEIRDIQGRLKEYDTPIDWEGRKDLIKEYNALYSRQRSNIPLSPEEQARMQEVLGLLQQGDAAVGNEEQTYGITEGMETFFGGTGGGIASNVINAGVTAVEALAQGQARAYTTDQYLVDIMSGNDPYERMARNEQAAQGIHDVLAPVYNYSDKLGDDAAKAIAKVKGGLGKYGDVAVDLGQNVLQMGFDAGAAALTGGSALAPMFIRVFGESAGEARKAGLSLGRQVGYGVAKGAIEVLTEKIFGGDIGKCYGAGFTDDAVAHAIERLGLSESGSVLLYALNGMNEEGLEEVISDLLAPFADAIKGDGSFQEWLDNGYNVEDMLYSYFIGAAIGGLGSVSQVASGQTRATLGAAALDNAVEDVKAKQTSPFNPNAAETTDAGGRATAVNPVAALTPETPSVAGENKAVPDSGTRATPAEVLAEASNPAGRKTAGEERAEAQAPEVKGELPGFDENGNRLNEEVTDSGTGTPQAAEQQTQEAEATPVDILAEQAGAKKTDAAVPKPETQKAVEDQTTDAGTGGSEVTANSYSGSQTRADTDQIIMDEAVRLLPEFNEDPVNIQRFADGHGAYGQYNINARVRILNLLYPDGDYYISGGAIVKGRTHGTSTGQSTRIGDTRTGSRHQEPHARRTPASGIKGPTAETNGFDPDSVKVGDTINHKTWGDVEVQSVNNGFATVIIPDTGEVKTVQLSGKYFNAPASETAEEAAPESEGNNEPETPAEPEAETAPEKKQIRSFRGEYSFLSNFYNTPVGEYRNAEAAFQAAKCVLPSDKAKFKNLSAVEAKRLGRRVKMRSDWNRVKVNVMLDIVRQKFANNPVLAQKLMATDGMELIEGNTWGDTTWGVDERTGKGDNWLGKILMQVRRELLASEGQNNSGRATAETRYDNVPEEGESANEAPSEELNTQESEEEEAKRVKIEDAEKIIVSEAEALSVDFEQDPINVQRFQSGQGNYGQYSIQERAAILQYLFPEEDYYISNGEIVKGRTYNTTTGQSEAFGDTRTGSNHKAPKKRPAPKSNIKAPTAQTSEFDADSVKAGDTLHHNKWGDVTVVDVNDGRVTIALPETGETKTVMLDGKYFSPAKVAAPSQSPAEEVKSTKVEPGRTEFDLGANNIIEQRATLKKVSPDSLEAAEARRSICYSVVDLVSGAKEALSDIKRYQYEGDEDAVKEAQKEYDDYIADLRKANITNANELEVNADWLRKKAKEAYDFDIDNGLEISEALKDAARSLDSAIRTIRWSKQIADDISRQDSANNATIAQNGKGGTENGKKGPRAFARGAETAGRSSEGNRRNPVQYDLGEGFGGLPRSERVKTNKTLHEQYKQKIVERGGRVLDESEIPAEIAGPLSRYREMFPDLPFSVVEDSSDTSAAWFQPSEDSRNINGGVFINSGKFLDMMHEEGVTGDQILGHEIGHYFLDASGLDSGGWLTPLCSALPGDPNVIADKIHQAAEVYRKYNPTLTDAQLIDEVAADVIGECRLGKVDPETYQLIRETLLDVVSDELPISVNGFTSGSAPSDPGANKSNRDSLFANEPAEQEYTGEYEDDDMTPLNERSREEDEKRRAEQKAATKKRFGTKNYNRLSDRLNSLTGWAKEYTEKYGELNKDEHGGIIQDENGNDTKNSVPQDIVRNLRAMLGGEITVQSFQTFYESLKSKEGESTQTDGNYFYDKDIATALNAFANAERELIYAENGGNKGAQKNVLYGESPSVEVAKENYDRAAENFANMFDTISDRYTDKFDERVDANHEIRENAKQEHEGLKNAFERIKDSFWLKQMRPDTFFEAIANFYEKTNQRLYNWANRAIQGEKDLINIRNNAQRFINEVTSDKKTAKAWRAIETGKVKGNVSIPGMKGQASLNYELGLLKLLMTNGSLDHIARFGAQFLNESDYIKGLNNDGLGETESYQMQNRLAPEILEQMARERLESAESKITGKTIYNEKIKILKQLRAELMSDVMANPAAKAMYEASIKAMQYLAEELNGVTLRMYGVAKALQGMYYWPMEVIGQGNNSQFLNNPAFDIENSSFLQHRKGGSGALFVRPFTETMSGYISRASNFAAFGELASDFKMMTKEIGVGHGANDAEKMSIKSSIEKNLGKKAAQYMERYIETINGTVTGKDSIWGKIRRNLASSSLLVDPGVAMKQKASYWNAMGILDPDVLLANRLVTFGPIRSARSYNNNPLLQEINKRTGILESRKAGYNVVEQGESLKKNRLSGKLTGWLPNWMTNWINKSDYKTVANLAMACARQVQKNSPGIDTKSDAYYKQVAELLEDVVVRTQPIYDPQFRADYLRSDNEYVRSTSMFRTQQTQNLNNLMQAYGELAAAKKNGSAEEVKNASTRATRVAAGIATSSLIYAGLQSISKLMRHRTKDFEDEEGNVDYKKVLKRFALDVFETLTGTVWFGDTVAKFAVDSATGALSNIKDKNGNPIVEKTSEFYDLADNTLTTINSVIISLITLASNPTPKAIKNAVFNSAQAGGVPVKNMYNFINGVVMFGYDAAHKNFNNYDDLVDMWQSWNGKSEGSKVTATAKAAMSYYKTGKTDRAKAALATLDYSSKDVRNAVKAVANTAYLNGEIDEMTYKGILRNYAKVDYKDIAGMVADKDLDKKAAEITATDPKKYNALVDAIDNAKDKVKTDESKANAVATAILDAAMSNTDTDTFMQKYTTSDYYKAYSALRDVYRPKMAVDLLLDIDSNKNDSYSQEELYNYYLENPGSENMVAKIWDANGYSQNWKQFKASKAKRAEYDVLANENKDNYQFGAAEKQLKQLKDDAGMYLQKAEADPKMLSTISDMKLSDKDTDTVVDRYVSSKTRTNYHVLRDAGYSAQKAIKALTKFDKDESGTISQEELWKRYKNHPEDEALIESLWNAQGYKGKNTSSWKTYKKYQKSKGK